MSASTAAKAVPAALAPTTIAAGEDRIPGEFLGFWRLIGDTGQAGGPLIVGRAADAFGLPATALLLSGIGLAAALTLALLVRETRTSPQSAASG